MQWRGRRESSNIEDRRGMSYGGHRGGGRMMLAGGGGIGGLIIILLILFMGGDPTALMGPGGPAGEGGPLPFDQPAARSPEEEELAKFVAVVLADTEDVWREQFRQMGRTYREPKLVFFSGKIDSACGFAAAASGPFYCPEDEKIYIDLAFYQELKRRFGAPGDFAQAYVIAHEVGHHVQKQLGATDRVHAMHGRVSEEEYNRASVRLELQADFYAGLWAHHAQRTKNILDPGDVEEALRCAAAIGDDRIQKQSQGYVVPDSFTHGSSEQRVRWFRKGFESGDIRQGDTFAARDL
jgi:predicted metalloprotease